ncbi:Tetratricopeptide repeat [Carpediemonas membranifera]|uniref:Tetratricopeptide repeat n=1 Tax=Carpediemonas membranifera TaxID=201153 RepID=A0A8J6BD03_9EUKA|nr:Tetratricopeptide repeat [Carpediemonas membranifera]|eukprot:KAG9397637.1 Tetratricopeptide repeat [Carpediemonas membranifera]
MQTSDTLSYITKADTFFDEGNYANAKYFYNLAANTDKYDLTSLYNRGICFLNLDDIDGCIRAMNQVLAGDQAELHALVMLASLMGREGHIEEADILYQRAIGVIQLYQHEPRDIPSHLRKAFTPEVLSSLLVDIYHHIAILCFNNDNTANSIAALNEGLSIAPGHTELRYLLGLAHLLLGNVEICMQNTQTVLKAVPDHSGAHHLMAVALFYQFRSDEALEHLTKAVESAQSAGLPIHGLVSDRALVYREVGEMKKAATDFRLLKEMDQPEPTVRVPRLAMDSLILTEPSIGGVLSANERRRRLRRKDHGHEVPQYHSGPVVPFTSGGVGHLHPSRAGLIVDPDIIFSLSITRQKARQPQSSPKSAGTSPKASREKLLYSPSSSGMITSSALNL